jgi:exodeoxyribonuclease VIII
MSAAAFAPGLYPNIEADKYHADKGAVSNSMLSDLADSPAHCFALHHAPERPAIEPTAAMKLGTLTHTALLEPEKVRTHYAVKPAGLNLGSAEGRKWKDAMVGLEIVTADDMAMVEAQRAAVMRDPLLASFFHAGQSEVSVFWIDKATGLRCKCRPDRIQYTGPNRVRVLDLKTTADITLDAVSRSICAYGYHRQQMHYTRGLEAHGLTVEQFVFGFVTKAYPFFAIPYELDDETQAQGGEEVAELMSLYASCHRSGNWPLTGGGPQIVGLPRWARRETEIEVSYAT